MRVTGTWAVCVSLSSLCLGGSVVADTVTWQQLPNGVAGANDISPDGRWVVGDIQGFGPCYRWDRLNNVMLNLPVDGVNAAAVSDDGKTILGTIIDPNLNSEVAAIWRESTNTWTSIGYLPTSGSCPSHSNGYELSADGRVAVGLSWVNGCHARAYRWTAATGMVELQLVGNAPIDSNRASVVSANGSLVAGFARNPAADRNPAIWNGITNVGTYVEYGTINDIPGEILGMNESGSIQLGTWNGKASRWTYPGLVRSSVGAGQIIPGWKGNAMDIDNHGTVVGFDNLAGNRRAWIQPGGTGPLVDLRTYIESNGGSVPENVLLEVCQAISNDGRVIIGHGGFSTGAWIVEITPVNLCPADIAPANGNGTVDIDDLVSVITHWGNCPGACPPACVGDINNNCVVDIDDLVGVITAWGVCPGPTGACCIDGNCQQLTQASCQSQGGNYLGNSVACSPTSCVTNDLCTDAIDITANINGAAVHGNNQLATPALFGGPDEDLPEGSPSCQYNQHPEGVHSTVWYSFIAPQNGQITIDTCNSDGTQFFDSILGLYSGVCSKLVEISCSEDGCAEPPTAPYYSRIYLSTLVPGQRYVICVANSGDSLYSLPGPFVLTITSP